MVVMKIVHFYYILNGHLKARGESSIFVVKNITSQSLCLFFDRRQYKSCKELDWFRQVGNNNNNSMIIHTLDLNSYL